MGWVMIDLRVVAAGGPADLNGLGMKIFFCSKVVSANVGGPWAQYRIGFWFWWAG